MVAKCVRRLLKLLKEAGRGRVKFGRMWKVFVQILRPRHIVVDRYLQRTPVARQAQTVMDTFGSRFRPFGLQVPQGTNGEVPQILDASSLSSFTAVECYISIDIDCVCLHLLTVSLGHHSLRP